MTEPHRLVLVSSRDDFLLEEALEEAVTAAAAGLGDAPVVELPGDVTPEQVATEVQSPSLFDPRRVLVVRDVRHWLDTTLPPGGDAERQRADPTPLVRVLEGGLPGDVALVLGAWCGREPRGALVTVIREHGTFQQVRLPDPPKPWEDVALSRAEETVLRRLLERRAPEVRLEPAAEALLFARLGFAPRLLLAEVTKLAAAAGGGPVTEELVRQLSFPRERSLDVVWDALDARDPAPMADLLEAGDRGVPVRDRQGKILDETALAFIVTGMVATRLADFLLIRRLMVRSGLEADLDPRRNSRPDWYRKHFKDGSGPRLQKLLGEAGGTAGRSRRVPGPWTLANMVRGASRYTDRELVTALAELGDLEIRLRSRAAPEALGAWLAGILCAPAHTPPRPAGGR